MLSSSGFPHNRVTSLYQSQIFFVSHFFPAKSRRRPPKDSHLSAQWRADPFLSLELFIVLALQPSHHHLIKAASRMYRLPLRSSLPLRTILAPTKLARRTLTTQGALPVSPSLPPPPPPPSDSSSSPPPLKSSTNSLATTFLAVTAATALGYVFGSGFVGDDKKGGRAASTSSSSSYPPPFGSLADYQSGIEELKALYAKNGRPDDVSTDPGDLEEHGVSEFTVLPEKRRVVYEKSESGIENLDSFRFMPAGAWSYHEEHRPNVVVWAERYVFPSLPSF